MLVLNVGTFGGPTRFSQLLVVCLLLGSSVLFVFILIDGRTPISFLEHPKFYMKKKKKKELFFFRI